MLGDVVTTLCYCLRGLSAGAGLTLLYAAFFLYEDEQQRVQNAIEVLWIRIAEQRTTSEKAGAFFQAVSGIGVRVFDRIFGPSSLSLQSFAVSFCMMCISFTLVAPFILAEHLPRNYLGEVGQGILVSTLLGLLPAWFQKRWAVWVSSVTLIAACVLVVGLVGYYNLWQGRRFDYVELVRLGGPIAAVLLTIVGVAIDRAVLKWCARRTTLGAALLVALLNVTFLTLAAGPWWFSSHPPPESLQNGPIAVFLLFVEYMSISTLFPALIAGLIIIVMGVIVLHRVLWPFMARPLYAIAQHGVVRQPKLLGSLGFGLFAFGIGSRQWLVSLGKIVGLN